MRLYSMKVQLKVPVVVRLEGTNVDQGKSILKVNFQIESPFESYIIDRMFTSSSKVMERKKKAIGNCCFDLKSGCRKVA